MIEIKNLTTAFIDEEKIRKIFEEKLKENKIDVLKIFFCGPEGIKKLNKEFFKKNRIVPFLIVKKSEKETEVYFCQKRMKKEAKREKKPFDLFFEEILEKVISSLKR